MSLDAKAFYNSYQCKDTRRNSNCNHESPNNIGYNWNSCVYLCKWPQVLKYLELLLGLSWYLSTRPGVSIVRLATSLVSGSVDCLKNVVDCEALIEAVKFQRYGLSCQFRHLVNPSYKLKLSTHKICCVVRRQWFSLEIRPLLLPPCRQWWNIPRQFIEVYLHGVAGPFIGVYSSHWPDWQSWILKIAGRSEFGRLRIIVLSVFQKLRFSAASDLPLLSLLQRTIRTGQQHYRRSAVMW